jgi:hypothetical protein
MWYMGEVSNKQRIGYATSPDGINWTDHGQVLGPSPGWDGDTVTGPCVILDNGTYKMWYNGRNGSGTSNCIGYATSTDGATWTKHPGNPVLAPSPGQWDAVHVFEPVVLLRGGSYEMWYSGYDGSTAYGRHGYATSSDGINWSKHGQNPVFPVGEPAAWDSDQASLSAVLVEGQAYKAWYMGYRAATNKYSVGYATSVPPQFTEVGPSAGVNDSGRGRGIAWGDYDNDGDIDLYVAQIGSANLLYRNNANGTFTEAGASAGVNDSGNGWRVVWGDYDNDGDLDLYLTNTGINRLYRNNGDGTFAEIGASAGVDDTGEGQGAAWADYDRDGDLDLYLAQAGGVDKFYQNNGNGSYADVRGTAGITDSGNGHGVAWGDYDNDGNLDLYVGNPGSPSLLHRNNGNGTFTEVGASAGVNSSQSAQSVAWADYDNDGDLDLYVANDGSANLMYRNGNGTFTDVAASAGVNDGGPGHDVAWGDYDNDGDLDIYLGNRDSANRLYQNNGNETFADIGATAGVNSTGPTLGLAWGDYDNDGDLDLYVARDGSANLLYKNNGNSNRWLVVKLVGTASNKSAIGSRATAVTGATRQRRDVVGGAGHYSQPSLPVEFGFGNSTTVDSLIVRWPSGQVQVLTNVATNQILTITEQAPIVSMSTTSVSVGNVNVGSWGTATFTVGNTGNAALSVTGITVSGTDAGQFAVSPTSFAVNVGAAAQPVTVTFTPGSTGAKSASLSIAHNAAGSPSTVSLSGTGTAPVCSLSSTSVAFGNVEKGQTSQQSCWIRNTGTATLTVSGMSDDSDQFSFSPGAPLNINAGDSTAVTVTFAPTSVGNKSGVIMITHNASGSPSSVSLSGTGQDTTAPAVPSTPTATAGNSQVALTWMPNPESDLAHYVVYRSTTGNFTPAVGDSIARVDKPNTTYTDTGLNPGTYYFKIAAVDSAGNKSSASAQTVATITILLRAADPVPSSLTFLGSSPSPLVVSVSDSGNTSLTVIPSLSGTDPGQFSVSPLATTVTPGATQSFAVTFTPSPTAGSNRSASLSLGHNASNKASPLTVALVGDVPPNLPAGLTATAGNNQATLTWTANTESDLSYCVVYRSTTSEALGDSIARMDKPAATYTDLGLNAGTYYFKRSLSRTLRHVREEFSVVLVLRRRRAAR